MVAIGVCGGVWFGLGLLRVGFGVQYGTMVHWTIFSHEVTINDTRE